MLIARTAVKIKHRSVDLSKVSPRLQPLLDAVRRRGDVVTAAAEGDPSDGVHLPNSLHYPSNNKGEGGLALDIRLNRPDEQGVYYDRELPLDFKILREADHYHISLDPEGKRV